VDSHAFVGYVMPSYYDSLLAKLIVHGHSRVEAVACMQRALDEVHIEGIKTTVPVHQKILRHPEFVAGRTSTQFLLRLLKER
jgi:acetyl-CoA carboxylase biotin carboxylase subunit